jgi:predicted enzyme related to lactoylglutathione lyase
MQRRKSTVPLPIRNIVFDCENTVRQAAFWAEVTGYTKRAAGVPIPEEVFTILADPAGSGIELFFNKVAEPKTAKNRVHFDLSAENLDGEVRRLEALGASQLETFRYGSTAWTVMSDPEGNEFCVAQRG